VSTAAAPTVGEVIRRSAAYLERHGVEGARANVETLLMKLLDTDRAGLYRREGVDTETAKALGRALCQRCAGMPLQHLTGEQAFFGLTLEVEPGVFVPRPETEIVVEAALGTVRGVAEPVVVDVGTGTGAIAMAIAHARPRAEVHATDRAPRAAALARRNADSLGLANVIVDEGDLLDPLPPALRGRVDLIVSNPPYVRPTDYADLPPEVRADPVQALIPDVPNGATGPDGLSGPTRPDDPSDRSRFDGTEMHRRLAAAAPDWLRPGGHLVMEIGDDQGPTVVGLLRAAGFVSIEVLEDLTGRDRAVTGRGPG
jgi:release factor glutamine methyltransferase